MKFKTFQEPSEANSDRPITLTSGQSVTVMIEARPFNNRTNVRFDAGAVYDLKATGKWFDASREAGPDGYRDGNFFQSMVWWSRRLADRNWFALLGVAEPEQTPFLIGTHATYHARRVGELICFANDVPGFYWNNTGAISLTITRIG